LLTERLFQRSSDREWTPRYVKGVVAGMVSLGRAALTALADRFLLDESPDAPEGKAQAAGAAGAAAVTGERKADYWSADEDVVDAMGFAQQGRTKRQRIAGRESETAAAIAAAAAAPTTFAAATSSHMSFRMLLALLLLPTPPPRKLLPG
jgi:hypothetical protein